MFKKSDKLLLETYIATDYEGLIVDRRSTIKYYTFLGGDLFI